MHISLHVRHVPGQIVFIHKMYAFKAQFMLNHCARFKKVDAVLYCYYI